MKIRDEECGNGLAATTVANGFTLLETLAYLAMLTVVLGVAIMSFHQSWDNSSHLRRNADDIVRALDTGDRWRADVRSATGQIELTDANGAEKLRIPTSTGEIVYVFSNGELRRQSASPPANTRLLANVQASQMQLDSRGRVSAWRWELELKSNPKRSQIRPLFTFESVGGTP